MGKWYKAGICVPTPNVEIVTPFTDTEMELAEKVGEIRDMAVDTRRIGNRVLRAANWLNRRKDATYFDYYKIGSDC